LTEEIAADRGLTVDRQAFETEMGYQKERARSAFKKEHTGSEAEIYRTLLGGIDQSDFVGYDRLDSHGTVLSLVLDGTQVDRAEQGMELEVFVDTTPFYAESGGQVGDTGTIETETGTLRVSDTQYALPGVHGHKAKVVRGTVHVGQDAELVVDAIERERTRKNHTGTHILHWALRDVVGEHVHQAGSLVAPDRLRFDFSHYEQVDSESLHHIEKVVNEKIIANETVTTVETSKAEAEKMGALAFFGDKYGDKVRVVTTGGFSTEFCGGTHVPSTGQVGPLVLVSEGSVGSNIRRVEALTGSAAYDHLSELRSRLGEVASVLKAEPSRVVDAARSMSDQLKATEVRLGEFEERDRAGAAEKLISDSEVVGKATLVSGRVDGIGGDGLRSLAFQIRDRIDTGVGVLGTVTDGKAALIVFITDDLVEDGLSAGEIAGIGAKALGGGGSRDPLLAQAGGPNTGAMDEALAEAAAASRSALITS